MGLWVLVCGSDIGVSPNILSAEVSVRGVAAVVRQFMFSITIFSCFAIMVTAISRLGTRESSMIEWNESAKDRQLWEGGSWGFRVLRVSATDILAEN